MHVPIDLREAARYMGVTGEAGEDVLTLLEAAAQKLRAAAQPRHIWKRVPLETGGDALTAGGLRLPGKDIASHLAGCRECLLLAATLGAAADRAIRAQAVVHMAQSLALNACAAAMLESYLNHVCREAEEHFAAQGLGLTARFSPGYGDLPLAIQPELLSLLEGRRIGLSVTGACMLVPEKSVTALMGVTSRSPGPPTRSFARSSAHNCSGCASRSCPFRKREGGQAREEKENPTNDNQGRSPAGKEDCDESF